MNESRIRSAWRWCAEAFEAINHNFREVFQTMRKRGDTSRAGHHGRHDVGQAVLPASRMPALLGGLDATGNAA